MPMGTAVSCSSTSAPIAAVGFALLAGETAPSLMLEGSANTSFGPMASVSSSGGTVCHSGGCQQGEGRLLHVIAKSAAARHSRWHQKGGVSSCPKRDWHRKGMDRIRSNS